MSSFILNDQYWQKTAFFLRNTASYLNKTLFLFNTADCRQSKEVQTIYFSPGSYVCSSFSSRCKKKTAACRVQWLVAIWQLHLMMMMMKKDARKKRTKKNLVFLFSHMSFNAVGVVYVIHDNDVKSAQKISLFLHDGWMLHRMNESSRLSMTHVLGKVFLINKQHFTLNFNIFQLK